MVKLDVRTGQIFGWGSVTLATITALSFFGFLPFDLTNFQIGFVLIILAAAIFNEIVIEEKTRRDRKRIDMFDALAIFLALFSGITGISIMLFGLSFPPEFKGAVGLLYLINSVMLVVEMHRDI